MMKVAPLDAPSLTTERLLLGMLQDSDFEQGELQLDEHRLLVYGIARE